MVKKKPFGSTGVDVATVGQGTWNLPEGGSRLSEAKRAIRRGIELGMTHLDTAEMYGAGQVERLLGEAIAGIERASLFITTKLLPGNASYRGTIDAAEGSLRRLNVDYVDLYLLHWPSRHPLRETMRAFEQLVRDGKARFVGVSNFEASDMLEAGSYLESERLACNQVLYHLGERGIEHEVIPAAYENGIAIVAYTPFGRGRLARAGDGVLDRIAAKHGATARQIVLAFVTREPNVFAIPKASRMEHVEENAGATNVTLDADDVAAIDGAFPRGPAGSLATL
jgi:diketogulonate reductase-like aldo/keto reductase